MSTTVDIERIDSLEKQVHELEAALQASRRIRTLILVSLLAVMALIIYLFMGLFHKVTSQSFQNAIAAEAQTRFEANQVRYMNDVKGVVDRASPVVTQAFYKQSKQDMPKYTAAIDEQREVFLKDIQSQLDAKLKAKYSRLLVDYEDRLVAEFPELKDDRFRAKVIRSLDKALNELVTKYYTDEMGMAIGRIYENWDRFPPVDEPGKNDPQLGDQLIGTLLELMSVRMSQ